ncbi:hypothetical protein Ddc_11991 [Ditylenchus destructor]|nr:hypothetical protein Ddc_11991 [Ditylenchus destructor]
MAGNWYKFSTSNKRTSARPHWSVSPVRKVGLQSKRLGNINAWQWCALGIVWSAARETETVVSRSWRALHLDSNPHTHQIEPYRRKAADTERHALSMIREWVQHLIPAHWSRYRPCAKLTTKQKDGNKCRQWCALGIVWSAARETETVVSSSFAVFLLSLQTSNVW